MKRNVSLVDRVSAFFLATLALILVGYSAVLYGVVRFHLQHQFDEQLHSAFRTLVAAVEVESDDVKFEPSDHTISLGIEEGLEDVRWVVSDEEGRIVDHSRNLTRGKQFDDELFAYAEQLRPEGTGSIDVGQWRVLQKRLAASAPKPVSERAPLERSAIVVSVARSPSDLNATLRTVAGIAIVLPLVVGLSAAVVGRRIVRHALQPVRDMARQARAMTDAEPQQRLPVPDTRDELAELGEAFNAVLDRLFESLERQRRFADDAAHQLRTPLAAVIGQADVALRRPRSSDEYHQTLSIVREQADELRQIVESLLFLARSQNDAAAPGTESIALSAWLPEYLSHWSGHSRLADLQLDLEDDVAITASPVLLKQLLDNLVSNALKYSAAGTPVRMAIQQHGEDAVLSVADQGIGIAAEDLRAVFQPFFRSAQARRSGAAGTGLGLAVASRIATALGGRMTCESELDKGSRFILIVPARPDAPRPAVSGLVNRANRS